MFDAAFWIALSSVIFFAALARPVGRMISSALDARADKIRQEIDEAVRLREEAQALFARYQRMQSDSVKEAEEILAHAREEAERQAEHAAEALEVALKRREEQAMDRIARAEQEALADVRGVAVDLAIRVTRKLLVERLDAKGQAALINEAVTGLDKKLH